MQLITVIFFNNYYSQSYNKFLTPNRFTKFVDLTTLMLYFQLG